MHDIVLEKHRDTIKTGVFGTTQLKVGGKYESQYEYYCWRDG